jgi:hypothetical protein
MAAAQPSVADDVAFVNAFTPYASFVELSRNIGTRSQTLGGRQEAWVPDSLTLEVAQLMLLESLPPDEAALVETALGTGETSSLSAEGLAVYRVIAGGTAEEVNEALANLPPALLEDMGEASPVGMVDGIRAPVYLMHDRADNLVPVQHARSLAGELGANVRYTEFSLFQHVDPTQSLGPMDQTRELWKLASHLYGILRVAR